MGRRLVSHLTGKVGVEGKITSIQGTGELISIVFRTDHSVTKRGFFAKYNVQQGNNNVTVLNNFVQLHVILKPLIFYEVGEVVGI